VTISNTKISPGPFPIVESLAPKQSRWQKSWLLFKKNRLAIVGLVIFTLFFLTAVAGLILTSGQDPVFDPALVRLQEKLRPPLSKPLPGNLRPEENPALGIFLLGTDNLGRDVFSRMLQGAWVSLRPLWLRIILSPALSIDTLIMGIVDIMLCFPSFFLILTVVALLPASIYNIMVVIGLTSWMGAARFVRAEFLSLREQDFVTAARALGIGDLRIIFRHMMPNAIAPVLVSATIGIASAILTEAGLSFLGFGVPPPHATWGNILADGKSFIFDAPWLTFIPGIAILIVVLSFNLFGEGLRDVLNPKLTVS